MFETLLMAVCISVLWLLTSLSLVGSGQNRRFACVIDQHLLCLPLGLECSFPPFSLLFDYSLAIAVYVMGWSNHARGAIDSEDAMECISIVVSDPSLGQLESLGFNGLNRIDIHLLGTCIQSTSGM